MQILLLSKKNPYPDHDGEAIAILQMAKGLVENGGKVTILYMNTPKHHFPVNEIPHEIRSLINFVAVDVDNSITVSGAIVNLFSSKPYHVTRFFDKNYLQAIISLMEQQHFDIVQAEGLYLTQYLALLPKKGTTKFIYRSHNIESEIWKNIAANTNKIFRKWYLQLQAKKLFEFEKTRMPSVDAIVAISHADILFYQQHLPNITLHHAPTGIDISTNNFIAANVDYSTIFFLGGLDWLPNIEGLEWFIDKVFPKILLEKPSVKLHIAGRNGDERWQKLSNEHIIYHGEVENAQTFVGDKYICIVPLLSGSGMKIKIVEAMNNHKPVVTTAKGIQGMPAGTDLHCYVSGNAQQFADNVIQLFESPDTGIKKAKEAQEFVRTNINNTFITNQLIHFYQKIAQ